MVYISDNSISGQFGRTYALTGTSTAFTATGLQYIYNLPRSQKVYPKGQLFKVFDRTKKVLDQTKLAASYSVLNNAVAVASTNWSLLYGGYVVFNSAQTAAGGTANEVQTLTNTSGSGGTFTLTFDDGTGNAQTTAAIAWNASAANIVTALVALSNIGAAGVTATGGPISTTPVAITFGGTALAGNPYAVMTVDNTLLTGGTIANAETTPGTSGFTMSGFYIPTSVASTVIEIPETKDWKITKNSNLIKNDVYGTGFARNVAGIAEGTFDFMANGIDNTLYDYQFNGSPIHLALYESSKTTPPRIWLCAGYVTQSPLDNPVTGMLAGQAQGTLVQWPTLIREAL